MIKISELQSKDVISITDGRKLGQIHDLELDLREGQITALVVPGESRFFGWMSGGKEWVIPWNQIVKIGADVILVRLDSHTLEDEPSPKPYLSHPSDNYRPT